MTLQNLSDKDLYKFCQEAGRNSRKWMREFAYALPEVERRELYRKRKFSTAYEFASKLAGMNHEICKRVLYLGERFREMPEVWEQVRIHGWTKLQTVVGVINKENQNIWIENLGRCSKSGLRLLIRQFQSEKVEKELEERGLERRKVQKLFVPGNEGPQFTEGELACPKHAYEERFAKQTPYSFPKMEALKFKVDANTKFKFKKLKMKLEKQKGALTMGETLRILIEKLEQQNNKAVKRKSAKISTGNKVGRYIPAVKRREIEKQQSDHCIAEKCDEPISEFHHVKRFSLEQSHEELVGVCKIHHQLAHGGYIDEKKWQIHWTGIQREEAIEKVDQKIRTFWPES